MTETNLQCYILPAKPVDLLLPIECVAEIIAKPEIDKFEQAPAKWMQGHVNWRNQRLPVMSYSALQNPELDESKRRNAHLVVLNPIPGAARKAYSALLCFGDVQQVQIDDSVSLTDQPEGMDKRYIESTLNLGGKDFVVPKLTALGVAFTYF